MPSLDETFRQLVDLLPAPSQLNPKWSDPLFYFVYEPSQAIEVKRRIPVWRAQLRERPGWNTRVVSFHEVLRTILDRGGQWSDFLKEEKNFEIQEINASIHDVLAQSLVPELEPYLITPGPDTVNLLIDIEMLHPYFRVHAIEAELHDRIQVPTVVFYPGRRSGTSGLSFLGIYPEDGSYHSSIVGGTL
jgi:Domain of unknown function (DUF1788)